MTRDGFRPLVPQGRAFSRPLRNPATTNRPGSQNGILTIDKGRFTVRRARLAPAMISTPGHRLPECANARPSAADRQMEGTHGIMITGAQCRSARTLLTWSVGKLANAASVSESAVNDFELERQPPDAATVDAIQRVFEGVGVEFLPVDDVRLRADPSAGQVTPL